MKKYIKALLLYLPAIAIVVGMSQLNKVQQWISFANQSPADLYVNINQSAGVPSRPWGNLAQGGESVDFSLKPLYAELAELKPEYLRIDHIYDFYINVQKNSSGQLTLDFSKLDSLIGEMRNADILPFISLSYMPAILSSDITGAPSNWSEYQEIIQQTIEHISGKQGLNLSDVYYEVWNEPDLFGNWKTYGDKNYLNLYTNAARAAAKASNTNSFKFGGPATTKLYPNWIRSFMKQVATYNLKLDFISWHHYTPNPDDYRIDTELLKNLMADYETYGRRVEVIISEWGPNSENDPSYDNSKSAAHLVSSLVEMMPVVDKAFVFELEDGKSPHNQEYWGRWGIFTHSDFGSHIKPRAEALKLLNRLGTDRIKVTGNGTWVKSLAARKGESIQLLVANYDQYSNHTENVPLTIDGLTPGTYRLSKTFISRSTYSQTIEINTSTYQTSIPMASNAVVLLELTRQ